MLKSGGGKDLEEFELYLAVPQLLFKNVHLGSKIIDSSFCDYSFTLRTRNTLLWRKNVTSVPLILKLQSCSV